MEKLTKKFKKMKLFLKTQLKKMQETLQ